MSKVKDVMIPIENYVTVGPDMSLLDMFKALEKDRQSKPGLKHAHRDVLVLDSKDGSIQGKVTMQDVIQALEPGYKRLGMKNVVSAAQDTLSRDYVAKIFRDFNLWSEPLTDLCRKTAELKVSEVMHTPEKGEFVEENDSLDKAAHRYIMGVHQPLLVRREGKVTGVLRFGDVFEKIREGMLACSL